LKTLRLIESQTRKLNVVYLKDISCKKDPFKILVSCILSTRTKDEITEKATKKLFKMADTPYKIAKLSLKHIQKLIYPVGFYRNKAKIILDLSKKIIKDFKGKVPSSKEELLKLKGVGEKCANLVLGLGFKIPSICVDTHVHRISNRLGWVKTKIPSATEKCLKKIIPKKYWIKLNTLLVAFGQNICKPVSPFCSKCKIDKNNLCPKRQVKRKR
jgi:endonuclease-3